MESLQEFLKGKKTYLICISTILGAIIAYANGADVGETVKIIVTALIGVTLRAGIAKNGQ